MDAVPGVFLLLLSTLSGTFGKKGYNCTDERFEECLEAITSITKTDNLALAATREELNKVCRNLQHGMRCVHDHSYRCFTHGEKMVFNSVVSKTGHVINELCVNEELQNEYLRYAPCLKNVSIDMRKCALQYKHFKRLSADLDEEQEGDPNAKLKKYCCVITDYVKCTQTHLLRDCGMQAKDFFQKNVDQMSGSLINEHCALYTHGSSACLFGHAVNINGQHELATSLMLIALLIIHYRVHR